MKVVTVYIVDNFDVVMMMVMVMSFISHNTLHKHPPTDHFHPHHPPNSIIEIDNEMIGCTLDGLNEKDVHAQWPTTAIIIRGISFV